MRESTIEKNICAFAKKHGIMAVKLSGPNNRGIPDRMFLKDGKAVFMELKATSRQPSALQRKRLRELGDLGFQATWYDEVERACEWLRGVFDL